MRLPFAHWFCLLPENPAVPKKIQGNSVILTRKYNKEYRLHVVRQFCMYVRLSLGLSALTKAMVSCAPLH